MKSSSEKLHDIVVIGGGPSGTAAALTAAQHGRSVLLIERNASAGHDYPGAWIGPAGVERLASFDITAKSVQTSEFRGIHLFSADLRKSSRVDDDDLTGWIIEPAALCDALWKRALAAGVEILAGVEPRQISDGEYCHYLHLSDNRRIAVRLLIVADGVGSPTSRMLFLPPEPLLTARTAFATMNSVDRQPRVNVVLGGGGLLATVLTGRQQTHVLVELRDRATDPADALRQFCAAAVDGGLIPQTVPSRQGCVSSVAGLALDRESHTGKGCLVVGRAGGFAAAFSNEAIYPAIESGCLAAEVAVQALAAAVPQDVLSTFGAVWRNTLADYLRMPNTDLGLLLPLVFSNPQMSRRVARAFLLGQPF